MTRVAAGRAVVEEALRLSVGLAVAFGEEPVIGGHGIEAGDEGGFVGGEVTNRHGRS